MERLDRIGPSPSPLSVERAPALERISRDRGREQRRPPERRRPEPEEPEADGLDDGTEHVDISA
jgi:hypothetical protein